jgi:hypothetical protein
MIICTDLPARRSGCAVAVDALASIETSTANVGSPVRPDRMRFLARFSGGVLR